MRDSTKNAARRRAASLLVLVVVAHRNRMMSVVRLDDQIGDRQLQLLGVISTRFITGRQPQPFAEKPTDICRLGDHYIIDPNYGHGKRRGLSGVLF